MKLVAITACSDDKGIVHQPGAEFELPDAMAKSLIEIKAAAKPGDVPAVTPLVGVSQFGEEPVLPTVEPAKPATK
ncbi:MAG: hypothetical protein KME42_14070 [Tildeniella nuda ZEHNDER 1965/U140]|jgi:hypothetical protein|nr:hypothetical protein [Tildeniella nuda ZEHNDER 1965/U140]